MKILQKSIWFSSFVLLAINTGCNSNNKANSETENEKDDMTAINDPHSFAEPSEAVMTHLDWEATVDFDAKRINGVAKISIQTGEQAEHLILDTKNLEIDKITLG